MRIELISTSVKYGLKVLDYIGSKTGYYTNWNDHVISSNSAYKVYVYKVIPGETYSVSLKINGLSVAGISFWEDSLPTPVPSNYSTGFVSVDSNSRGNSPATELTNHQITPTTEYVYFSNLKSDPAPTITHVSE